VLIAEVDDARIYASCVAAGTERIMHVSVRHLAAPGDGPLRESSIEFCGPSVIDASAPTGWTVSVDREERHSVEWSLPDALVATLGIPSGVKSGGFVVRLRPG